MLHATTRTPPGAYDEFLKIFLVGDSQSGKKSLLVRFADDTFTPHFLTTIGMDFKLRTIVIGDKRVKLQMWHNSNFGRRFANCSLKGIAIVGLVIDLTQLSKSNIEDSFAKWIKHIKTYNDEGTTIMVLGTKCDLSRNDISYEDFYLCAAKHGCLPAIVSAKTGEGIEEAFYHAAEMHLIKTGKISINSDNKEKGEKEENDETPEKSTNPGRCSLM
jgi:GTPase SAR1 family protein